MNHVVTSIADAVQMALPIGRVLAHELADDREDGEGGQGERPPVEPELGCHIYVVYGCLLQRLVLGGAGFKLFCKIGQLGVGGVESVSASMVDGDGDFDCSIEVWGEPVVVSSRRTLKPSSTYSGTYLNSRNLSRRNSWPSSGMLTQRLPWRQMDEVPSIANRTVTELSVCGAK